MRGGAMIVILALTMVVLPCNGYGVRVRVENSTVTTDQFIEQPAVQGSQLIEVFDNKL